MTKYKVTNIETGEVQYRHEADMLHVDGFFQLLLNNPPVYPEGETPEGAPTEPTPVNAYNSQVHLVEEDKDA